MLTNGAVPRPHLCTPSRVFSLLAATATALAPPFLAKYALDDAINDTTGGRLWLVVGIFVAAGLANWGMTYVETYMTGWVGERILADLRKQLFGHLQRLSLGFYERNRAGVLISRMTNDVEAIDQLVTDGVTTLAQSTLTLAGTAVLLLVLDWRLALATLAVIPFMSVATALFRSRSARAYAARAGAARASSRRRSPRTSPGCGWCRRSRARSSRRRTSARSRAATATRTCRRSS